MHTLGTPFGTVEIKPTSADHVWVDGGARDLNAPESSSFRPGIKINGVKLSVRVDLHRWSDGSWKIGREDDQYATYHGVHATRIDWVNVRDMDASEAARRKIRGVLVPLAIEWIESPEGIDALVQASIKDTQRRIEAKNSEIRKLREQLETAEAELAAMYQEEGA